MTCGWCKGSPFTCCCKFTEPRHSGLQLGCGGGGKQHWSRQHQSQAANPRPPTTTVFLHISRSVFGEYTRHSGARWDMSLLAPYFLVQVAHCAWCGFWWPGGGVCCWVQAIGQWKAGTRAPVSPGGTSGLVQQRPTLELGPRAVLGCTARIYQGITATPCPPPVLRLILARREEEDSSAGRRGETASNTVSPTHTMHIILFRVFTYRADDDYDARNAVEMFGDICRCRRSCMCDRVELFLALLALFAFLLHSD